ncbi:alpha/beta fold hydrolase [Amycolatopsis mediterranei]|uniref:alpha/beta hydrolase n=1 Tax=Amycolatopsis mediterranei TaxID=33910 RepID=UPI00341BD29E
MTTPHDVSFTVEGIEIAGHLHMPDAAAPGPAVLIAGPSPQVKEQVPDTYAARLAAMGFRALTIDYRNFGASGGEPRLREDPAGKLADLRAAVSFLSHLPEVDPHHIAIVGVCAGAGYALTAAARDPRIRAFVGIAGFYPGLAELRQTMGPQVYQEALREAIGVLEREDRGGPVRYIPHVAPDGGTALLTGGEVYEYYGTARGHAANYRNEITADTGYTMLTLDLANAAPLLGPTPALLVHGEKDAYCTPEQAQSVHERLNGPKEILWLPTNTHIGYYDDPAYITPAIDSAVAFLESLFH